MKIEKATHENGKYTTPCTHFPDIKIGSPHCIGIPFFRLPKCHYCQSFEVQEKVYSELLNIKIPIVKTVRCKFIKPINQI